MLPKSGTAGRPDVKALRERAMSLDSGVFWKPGEGVNQIRILPGWDPEDATGRFFFEQALHYGFRDEEDEREVTIPCFLYTTGATCPVCALRKWLSEQETEAAKRIYKRTAPQLGVYFNVIGRKVKPSRVQVWRTSGQKRDTVLDWLSTDDYADLLDPEKGRDVILTATGESKTRRYPGFTPAGNPSPIGVENWQQNLFNLDKIVPVKMSMEEARIVIVRQYGGAFPVEEILG
jgi:hypothetical protein